MDWTNADELVALVDRLSALVGENEWLEFKVGNDDPDELGQYISCLSNSAALVGQDTAFMLWGIRDSDRAVVGTAARPGQAKRGNEDLRAWLLRFLDPHVDFSFHTVDVRGKTVVIMRVDAASKLPVKFKHVEYMRIGSYKKPLSKHPDHQRRLWKILDGKYSTPTPSKAGLLLQTYRWNRWFSSSTTRPSSRFISCRSRRVGRQ